MFGFFLIVLTLGLIILFPLLWVNSLYWDRGKIPPYYTYTPQHELEILIALSGIVVRNDFRDLAEKKQYLNDYLNQHYGEDNYDFTDSFRQAYQSPLHLESIAGWFNRHCAEATHKLNIVQFAISLAMIDGQLIDREYRVIQQLHRFLKLPEHEFDRLVSIHLHNQSEQKQEREISNRTSDTKLERCYHILGIPADADADVLKRAYRTLVKEHHPDRLIHATSIQRQLANERFIAIQQAYEHIEQRRK